MSQVSFLIYHRGLFETNTFWQSSYHSSSKSSPSCLSQVLQMRSRSTTKSYSDHYSIPLCGKYEEMSLRALGCSLPPFPKHPRALSLTTSLSPFLVSSKSC